jgi:hypothetical protein
LQPANEEKREEKRGPKQIKKSFGKVKKVYTFALPNGTARKRGKLGKKKKREGS